MQCSLPKPKADVPRSLLGQTVLSACLLHAALSMHRKKVGRRNINVAKAQCLVCMLLSVSGGKLETRLECQDPSITSGQTNTHTQKVMLNQAFSRTFTLCNNGQSMALPCQAM